MSWGLLDDDDLLDLRRNTDPKTVVRERRDSAPASNADLSQWSAEASSTGCHLCERSQKLVCQSCGKGACAAHSWVMLGVCRDCATEDRMKAWKKGRTASETNWLERP